MLKQVSGSNDYNWTGTEKEIRGLVAYLEFFDVYIPELKTIFTVSGKQGHGHYQLEPDWHRNYIWLEFPQHHYLVEQFNKLMKEDTCLTP